MAITDIPQTRVPSVLTEADNRGAVQSLTDQPHDVILMGYRRSTGSVAALTIVPIVGELDGDGFFGDGAQLAEMSRAYRSLDRSTNLWAVAFDDAGSGVAATGTYVFAGTATAQGIVALRIAGRRITVLVASGTAAADVATAVAAAINADVRLPVTAAAATATVTCTAKWTGPSGNDIVLEKNTVSTDADVAGITNTITAMASGATPEDVDSAIALWGDQRYDTVVSGLADAASMAKVEAALLARKGSQVQLEGQAFHGVRGNVSALLAIGGARNSAENTLVPAGLSPTPPWIWATQVAARNAVRTQSDPNRPSTRLTLPGCLPPAQGDDFDFGARDQLLNSGVSTIRLDGGGNPVIERLITTYQENAGGTADTSLLDLTTARAQNFLRQDWRTHITTKYPDYKLANDGTNYEPGQPVVTPLTIQAEAIARFELWERQALVEGLEQFKADLIATRSTVDVNRVDSVLSPDIVNKFIVLATRFAFRT